MYEKALGTCFFSEKKEGTAMCSVKVGNTVEEKGSHFVERDWRK